jgi:GxxExxY protein
MKNGDRGVESPFNRRNDQEFKHGEVTQKVIKVFFDVYNELGYGFLESVYAKSLEIALNASGTKARRRIEIPVTFRGYGVGDFEADMLVEDCVLLELKSVRALDASHSAQLLTTCARLISKWDSCLTLAQSPSLSGFYSIILEKQAAQIRCGLMRS